MSSILNSILKKITGHCIEIQIQNLIYRIHCVIVSIIKAIMFITSIMKYESCEVLLFL